MFQEQKFLSIIILPKLSILHFTMGPLSFILICFIMYDTPYTLTKPTQPIIVVFFIVTKHLEVSFLSVKIGIPVER